MVSQLSTLNSQLLQQHFDTLAETPDAVAKLRHLVVELAAHGVFGGAGAKSVLLGTEAQFVMGQAPPGMECNESGDGTIFVKAGEFGALYPEICCWTTKPLRLSKKGDVLICVVGATVGKLNLAIDSAIGRSVAAIRPSERLDTRYLYYSLMPFTLRLRGASRGSAYGVIGKDELNAVKLLLPTVAEQRRIVAKVEELLALCDELAARQTAAREHRTRLVRSALDHLTTAQSEPEFRQHAAFVLQHSDLVLDSVTDLRKVILSLAVQGRVVPRNPKDESATVLLEQIARAKAKAAEPRRKTEPKDEASIHEPPYSLPQSWQWARFDAVAIIESNLVPPAEFPDHPHVAPDNIEKATGKLLDYRTVQEDEVKSSNHRFFPGQIIYSKIRPNLSKATIVDFEGLCSADMYPVVPHINSRYLLTYILSSVFLGMAVRNDTRVAMPKINQEELNQVLVAVPPLAEQQRIVAKVDELLRWCDALEARLTAAQTTAAALLDATLHQILTA
jgi:type I restriction enzyme S subunit